MNKNTRTVTGLMTGRDCSTGKWYARAHVQGIGECQQWGQTENGAISNLENHVFVQCGNDKPVWEC